MKSSIVFTTIHANKIVTELCENILKYGHQDNCEIIVIPDKKTPKSVYEECVACGSGEISVKCPTLEEQEAILLKLGLGNNFIPFNSDNRRNIGYLMAIMSSDVVISIDDDNYPMDADFVGEHCAPFTMSNESKLLSSSNNWFNPIDFLEFDCIGKDVIYTRGYPYKYRRNKAKYEYQTIQTSPEDIYLNAGLWLQDPDVDAITRVTAPGTSKKLSEKFNDVIIAENVWTTINTQNTAIRSDAIAAYYFLRMNYNIQGLTMDRYGDIFSGYFVERCIKSLGKQIKYGTPVALHRRNRHNFFNDIACELPCIMVIEELIDWLIKVPLEGASIVDLYTDLANKMEEAVELEFKGSIWSAELRAYFHDTAYRMRKWADTFRLIRGL